MGTQTTYHSRGWPSEWLVPLAINSSWLTPELYLGDRPQYEYANLLQYSPPYWLQSKSHQARITPLAKFLSVSISA
jgi:hypothetical protein